MGTILQRFSKVNADPDFACIESFAPYGWTAFGVLLVALISLAIDDRIKSSSRPAGSAEERQRLNA
jgi:heme exporter protein D